MSNKNTKQNNKKKNQQNKKYDDVPAFKSPAKTLWGKILIIVIVFAMIILPVVGLVFALINL